MTLEPSAAYACELWRQRAVKAEAARDELLAALKAIGLTLLADGPGGAVHMPSVVRARDISKAAIAKAEGQ